MISLYYNRKALSVEKEKIDEAEFVPPASCGKLEFEETFTAGVE